MPQFTDAPGQTQSPPATSTAGRSEGQTQAQQTEPLGWKAQFPEDLREVLKPFEKPGDFAKAFKESQEKIGKAIVLPEEEGADLGEIYKRLGRPEKPEEYEFEKDPSLKLDEKSEALWRKAAHEAGLTKKQASILFAHEQSAALEARKAREVTANSRAEEIKKLEALNKQKITDLWGPKTDERLEKISRYYEANQGLSKKLESAGLSKDPEIQQLIWGLVEKTSDPLISGQTPKTSPDLLRARYPKSKF
jgi:hypothetical protein